MLILGGTSEASALARALQHDARYQLVLSYAGVTRAPVAPPVPIRIGGFGGVAGLARYLRENAVDCVIDATHPFAARITGHAVAACRETGVDLVIMNRPAWHPEAGDRWQAVPDMPAAASVLGPVPRRVFLTIGQKDLAPFAAAPWHHYLIRSIEPVPEGLLPDAAKLLGRPPFSVMDESALLERYGIELLVTKNSGGAASAAKLLAARERGIPVVMVARPAVPSAQTVPDTEAALRWLHHRMCRGV